MSDPAKDALAAVAAAREQGSADPASPIATDFTKPMTRWSIDVVEPSTGKKYTGTFVSRIPKATEQADHYVAMGRLAAGTPWASIPPAGRQLIDMQIAFVARLVEKPPWFVPETFYDQTVLLAVYAKILEHEDGFFRRGPGGARGQETAPDPAGEAAALVR